MKTRRRRPTPRGHLTPYTIRLARALAWVMMGLVIAGYAAMVWQAVGK